MHKRKHKKPTGHLSAQQLLARSKPQPIDPPLPDEKDQIESTIMTRAWTLKPGLFGAAALPTQLQENDHDFHAQSANDGTEIWIDLQEIYGLTEKNRGYQYLPDKRSAKSFAEAILKNLKKKIIDGYGGSKSGSIGRTHILLYSTDWRLVPTDDVLHLLRLYVYRENLPIASIEYLRYGGNEEVLRIHPASLEYLCWVVQHETLLELVQEQVVNAADGVLDQEDLSWRFRLSEEVSIGISATRDDEPVTDIIVGAFMVDTASFIDPNDVPPSVT